MNLSSHKPSDLGALDAIRVRQFRKEGARAGHVSASRARLILIDWPAVSPGQLLDARIDRLLAAVEREGEDRLEASLRLFYLHGHGCLTPDQASRFGLGLWSRMDSAEPGLPVGHGLYLVTLANLPHPPAIDVEARLELRLYGAAELPEPLALDWPWPWWTGLGPRKPPMHGSLKARWMLCPKSARLPREILIRMRIEGAGNGHVQFPAGQRCPLLARQRRRGRPA
ncbi:hypothetical protein D1604_14620 [Brevundimonas sp. LPMIX5]|nr:hypothetical protein D1604_14620 [Brevundimonas sp. LPMIX5]